MMLKLLDVIRSVIDTELSQKLAPFGTVINQVMVASLDVTENTEAERKQVLEAIKVLYPGHSYSWHDCGHDDGAACTMAEAI